MKGRRKERSKSPIEVDLLPVKNEQYLLIIKRRIYFGI